jgi:glycosyltransferase involved in cell wall biosynthesis
MRILFVSSHYHPSVGGIQTQLRLVARDLASRHRVSVAAIDLGAPPALVRLRTYAGSGLSHGRSVVKLLDAMEGSLFLPGKQTRVDGGVSVYTLAPTALERLRLLRIAGRKTVAPGPGDKSPRQNVYRTFRSIYAPKLSALARGNDVVHSLGSNRLSWVAEEVARAEGIPFVSTPYVHPDKQSSAGPRASAFRWADIVFALLETDAAKLVELGVPPERIRIQGVVPLLPEERDPQRFRARHGLGQSPVVLFVGRVTKKKGVRALLDAAELAWRDAPDVRFVFAGPAGGAERRWFAAPRDERLRYLGEISEQEKGDAFAACDLFCMPSSEEILPAVYLEAWSCGKAVIGGPAYGLRELIEGNRAGLVVSQDPEEIAARLVELLRDAPRRREMGERGRELVRRRFTRQAVVGALEDAYSELVRQPVETLA